MSLEPENITLKDFIHQVAIGRIIHSSPIAQTAAGTYVHIGYGPLAPKMYLITDLLAPKLATSTHTHQMLLAGTGSSQSQTTSSTTFVSLLTTLPTITIPTGLPSGTLLQLLVLSCVEASQSVAADSYDLRIGRTLPSLSMNSFAGFNNTTIVAHGLLTTLSFLNPPSGQWTFDTQGEVSLGANVLTATQIQMSIIGLLTQAPISGT